MTKENNRGRESKRYRVSLVEQKTERVLWQRHFTKPLLWLSVTAAALIGAALTMQGINPGPMMFQANQVVIYAFFIIVLYASFFNLGISRLLIPLYAKISRLQPRYLIPVIFALAILGCYTTDNSVANVFTLLLFGALGVVLRKFRIPLGPFILGYLIGPAAERSLRQALNMGKGGVTMLFQRPIAIFFYVLTVVFVVVVLYTFRKNKEVLDKGAHSDDE